MSAPFVVLLAQGQLFNPHKSAPMLIYCTALALILMLGILLHSAVPVYVALVLLPATLVRRSVWQALGSSLVLLLCLAIAQSYGLVLHAPNLEHTQTAALGSFVLGLVFIALQRYQLQTVRSGLDAELQRRTVELQAEIEHRRGMEALARESELRYRLVAEHSLDIIWTLDLKTRHFSYISPAVKTLRGYSVAEALHQSLEQAFTSDSLQRFQRYLDHLLEVGQLHASHWELEQPCRNGKTIWTEVSVNLVRDTNGQLQELLGVSRDITERRELRQQLEQLAHYDTLTKLPNRVLFMQRLQQALERVEADPEYGFALLFLDLNGFKLINDRYGHHCGDLLLHGCAQRLKSVLSATDTVARLGGDEFIVLLPNVKQRQPAERVSLRLRQALREPFELEDNVCSIGTSIGIALCPQDGQDCDELISRADHRMYTQKYRERELQL